MTNIFAKLSSLTGGVHGSSYTDVAATLEELRKSGKVVSISFDGCGKQFSTRVTAFNAAHKIFVIDNIFPPVHENLLTRGRTVTISFKENDRIVSLQSKYVEPLVANAEMGHEMKIQSALQSVEAPAEPNVDAALLNRTAIRSAGNRKVVGM